MAGKKTYSSPQGTLGMPNDFVIGKATGCADCFFDSVAQGMNELCILGGPFNVKSLKRATHDYAEGNQIAVNDSRTGITLRKAIADTAAEGICSSGGRNEYAEFASCLVYIQLNAAE